ncbi:energy-coupling factor ABC transporter ATP-binding protein [Eubacteriales bacterium KG127]
MNNNDVIIKAEDIFFSYDDEQTYSLNGFSLELSKGKKIAFLGANGAGKSTFFLSLNGINKLVRGRLEVDGKEVKYDKKSLQELRSKVGIVFQDPDNQLFSASVRQEISFGPMNMGMNMEDVDKAVDKVVEKLLIGPFVHKATHALSGGQKKQVSIADVLIMMPKIVILDEPASSLDPKHTIIVNGIIEMMVEEGITVLVSTHDVNYAYGWADEVVVIHDGKVLMHDEPRKVFHSKEVLNKANLETPTVLEFYDRLVAKGIIDMAKETPRTIEQLDKLIK